VKSRGIEKTRTGVDGDGSARKKKALQTENESESYSNDEPGKEGRKYRDEKNGVFSRIEEKLWEERVETRGGWIILRRRIVSWGRKRDRLTLKRKNVFHR